MAGYILIDLEITDPEGFKVAKNRAIVVQGLMIFDNRIGE